MAKSVGNLPEFGRPPVVETAVGVEFTPLEKWSIPHFGLFWSEIRERYPSFQTRYPPIHMPSPYTEVSSSEVLQVAALIPVRCQFLDETGSRLIQVQNDRFLYNWQRLTGTEDYPHYHNIRPSFEAEWSRFQSLLSTERMGVPDVQVCEVTYVNHIEQGQGWETLADLPSVLVGRSDVAGTGSLSALGAIAVDEIYPIPNGPGQLRVQLGSALRNTDGKEILQLILTARIQPVSAAINDLLDCLDRGHEIVVRSFADYTTSQMHELWLRRDAT